MATIGCLNDNGIVINWTETMPGVLIGSEQSLVLNGPPCGTPAGTYFPNNPGLAIMGINSVPTAIWQQIKSSNAQARVQSLLTSGVLVELSLP